MEAQHSMSAQAKPGEGPIGKIAVSAKEAILFDGTPVTFDALKTKLAELKKRDGVVWYYREAAGAEPPAKAMEVMKLIMDNKLPISMSTKPDYSDVVMPDGTTKPRASSGKR
jgi:hypothetical protein